MGVVVLDADRKVTKFNAWAEKITGFSSEDAVSHFCGDILRGALCSGCCPLEAVIDRSKPVVRAETSLTTRSGNTIPVRMHTAQGYSTHREDSWGPWKHFETFLTNLPANENALT